jgi:hypothetical protein
LNVSVEKVKKTFENTTQYATNVMAGNHIMQTIQSPYPALNVMWTAQKESKNPATQGCVSFWWGFCVAGKSGGGFWQGWWKNLVGGSGGNSVWRANLVKNSGGDSVWVAGQSGFCVSGEKIWQEILAEILHPFCVKVALCLGLRIFIFCNIQTHTHTNRQTDEQLKLLLRDTTTRTHENRQ